MSLLTKNSFRLLTGYALMNTLDNSYKSESSNKTYNDGLNKYRYISIVLVK